MGVIDKYGHSVGASSNYAVDEAGKILSWNDPRTAKIRSKTFPGVAKAMAEQWGTGEIYVPEKDKYEQIKITELVEEE